MTTPQTDDRRGATSASSAQADLNCPGRFLAQKGLVDTGGEYAEHGNVIHEALRTGKVDGLSLEQRETYESCLAIEAKLVTALFPEMATSKAQAKVWREQRFWVKVPRPDAKTEKDVYEHSGKTDVVYRLGQRAAIFEYKTLMGDVPSSPTNLQLRDQAVLVSGNLLVQEIAVAPIQPLVTHTPEVCYYNAADLKRSESDMFARVIASNNPQSPRVPGELQCKFCLAKTKCLEYQKWAGQMVPNMLTLLDVPIEGWSPEQRSFFLERRIIAQKWLDDCEAAIKAGLKDDPQYVTGWRLTEGAVREKIIDPQTLFERFTKLGGSLEQFMKCVSITKTSLKEQVSAVTNARGAALSKSMKTITEGLVEFKQNEPSLQRSK